MTNPLLPSLGSDLLAQAKLRSASSSSRRLRTSFPSIDGAIDGIQYGRITNIQCEVAGYGTTLAHHIITSHLLDPSREEGREGEGSQVAYVDTTGTFSAVNLLKVLEFRLQQTATQEHDAAAAAAAQGVRQQAVELLDRVQYMRTFDFDGVMETVAEVFGGLPKDEVDEVVVVKQPNVEGETPKLQGVEEDMEDARHDEMEVRTGIEILEEVKEEQAPEGNEDVMEVEPAGSPERGLGERTEIPDSEADSDEEIFWPVPLLPKHDPGLKGTKKRRRDISEAELGPETKISVEAEELHVNDPETSRSPELEEEEELPVLPNPEGDEEEPPQPLGSRNFGVIVFDNISRPLENLLEKSEVEANSKLTLLSRGLRSLARDKGIAILLLSTPVIQLPTAKDQRKDIYIKNSSIFARIQPTEGLPRTLGSCLDHSIVISRYPKDDITSHRRRSGGQDKFIIEVMADRHGRGVSQWGGFMIKGDIEFVELFKEDKKETQNLDHLLTENERRGKGAFGRWSRD
ncbi:hypothetical protein TWF281_004688 [Arthrobotrys megalospora]